MVDSYSLDTGRLISVTSIENFLRTTSAVVRLKVKISSYPISPIFTFLFFSLQCNIQILLEVPSFQSILESELSIEFSECWSSGSLCDQWQEMEYRKRWEHEIVFIDESVESQHRTQSKNFHRCWDLGIEWQSFWHFIADIKSIIKIKCWWWAHRCGWLLLFRRALSSSRGIEIPRLWWWLVVPCLLAIWCRSESVVNTKNRFRRFSISLRS